ncbi:hypothetical protein BSX36_02350 [Listeria monocytogenes]|uniref:hypothetical protein n=1 Tax=Listeria monocytogenes TaxID=1639 RepID=UPI000868F47B|nr:hypothetical protein [Listeria monocytogenes]EAC4663607.1 hypothetical protein [Listeria monocytogenes]EAD1641049.1 hypothetical protein [Listeria monocytogenes]EAD1643902.1 hypothetical protein [Listeria monocytogenes]EAD1659256.1 hypothetical protein [Listeria monocytogenes]EAD3115650.1 hypothetical protein [Listeria monocytogenes]
MSVILKTDRWSFKTKREMIEEQVNLVRDKNDDVLRRLQEVDNQLSGQAAEAFTSSVLAMVLKTEKHLLSIEEGLKTFEEYLDEIGEIETTVQNNIDGIGL